MSDPNTQSEIIELFMEERQKMKKEFKKIIKRIKKKTFENFLVGKHANNYQGFDDNMSFDFDNWLDGLEVDDVIRYANEYTKQSLTDILKEIEL